MRMVITADVHFGSSDHLGRINPQTGLHTRLEDFLRNFDKIIDYVLDPSKKIDKFIIAGDLYKTRHPTNIQQEEFGKRLARLSAAGKETFILLGNHDILVSEGASHTAGVIKALQPSHIKVIDTPAVVGELGFMPYIYRQRLGLKTNEEALEYYGKEIEKLKQQGAKILVGHQSVEGARMPAGYIDPEVMTEIVIPQSMLKGFQFCVYGHIHEYQVVCKDPVTVYTGPIDRIDFSQTEKPCGFVVYDTETNRHGFVELETVDLYYIRADLTSGGGDMTQRVLSSIDMTRLANSIATLVVDIKETDMGKLNRTEVQKVLDTARFCAGFKLRVQRERTSRNEQVNETVSALEALKQYVQGREDLKDIADELVKVGADTIKLCDLNRQ